jgi:hypothetical protein
VTKLREMRRGGPALRCTRHDFRLNSRIVATLSWNHADLFRYDVTADGQRFLIVKPESREEAPLPGPPTLRCGRRLALHDRGT